MVWSVWAVWLDSDSRLVILGILIILAAYAVSLKGEMIPGGTRVDLGSELTLYRRRNTSCPYLDLPNMSSAIRLPGSYIGSPGSYKPS